MSARPQVAAQVKAAAQAFYRGDRAAAYQLVRTALLSDSTSIEAWLWLSKLVDDPPRQRECFERVLMLDPQNSVARDQLERLRLRQLLATVHAPVIHDRYAGPRQIGAYLVDRMLITENQLQDALAEQRSLRRRGVFVQLGDILLQNDLLSPGTLAHALVKQFDEMAARAYSATPRFLGEYLIVEGLITPLQLQTALEDQMRLRLTGKPVAIGTLLLRNKCIDSAALQKVLEQQRSEFHSRMGD